MNYDEIKESAKKSGLIPTLGMEITELDDGYCRGEMPLNEKTCNPYGTVHGGCIYAFADTIGGSAALTKSQKVVTLDSHMNFLKAASNEGKLIAEGKVVRHGNKVAVYHVDVMTTAGVHVAEATYSFYVLE
ncbi:MAG: PaaI family thioesterase [Lachnospiraceae bacterium]|nr:PaaI family thioesterase [Lachnospiraceae bacterium]